MEKRLINVRVDATHLKKVRILRERGVMLSDLVRDAIDRQYEQVVQRLQPRDVRSIVNELYKQFPDEPNLPERDYDVHQRPEARRTIRRKLQRKSR